MDILITGANGFVGRNLLERLSTEEHRIWAVGRNDNESLSNKKLTWIKQDLSLTIKTENFPSSIDVVIHLAQSEHFRNFPEKANEIFDVNTNSTQRLLDYARSADAKQFILASSGGIYGYGNQAFDEESVPANQGELGFYLGTKLCSEILAENYQSFFNVIVLRFFFIYGYNQRKTMLIPRLISSVREGLPIKLQGENGIIINPIHVSDAVAAIRECLFLKENNKFNVCGLDVLSLREIAEIIGEITDGKPVFEIENSPIIRNLVGDTQKMAKNLFKPQMSFREGIKDAARI